MNKINNDTSQKQRQQTQRGLLAVSQVGVQAYFKAEPYEQLKRLITENETDMLCQKINMMSSGFC